MAYNSDIENKDINYLGKDFNSFKQNLSNFAKTYFPTIYNDYSDASPGTMFIELAAYVGDVLSYYMDSQLKESMLPYAKERANVIALANTLGYRVKPTQASKATVEAFIILPANTDGNPDWKYAPILQQNTQVKSTQGGVSFTTDRDIDFQYSSSFDPTTTSVYKINESTNLPSYFLLKKSVNVTSATRTTSEFAIAGQERYKKIELTPSNVITIESVTDSEGHTWSEVPYLAQETVFQEMTNTSYSDQTLSEYKNTAPYLLRLKKTSKRFITRTNNKNRTELIFGSGVAVSADELIIPNPENVGLNSDDGINSLDKAFDPSNFLHTKSYGQAPKNTTLTVKYQTGGGTAANVAAGTITSIDTAFWTTQADDIDASVYADVKKSLAVNNPIAAGGGRGAENISEIKQNAMAYFQTQNRIVTREDYIGRIYSMPPRFGNIAKAYVSAGAINTYLNGEEENRNPNVTNIYLLGYNASKKLDTVNDAVKENLKTYLTPYRMLTDAINIKNGFVVNIAVEFEIIPLPNKNSNEVLLSCISAVKTYFNIDRWQFNEPINISDLTTTIAAVDGVQSVQNLLITNKWKLSNNYSGNKYNIESATKNGIIYPPVDPAVFELKFPNNDIKGKVSSY